EVDAGAILVVLESMKMETAIRAPYAGRVREVLATVNSQVDAGAPLLRFDQVGEEAAVRLAPRVSFAVPAPAAEVDQRTEALARLATLSALITGYDVSATHARALHADYERLRHGVAHDDSELVRAELRLLNTFADICELGRNRPTTAESETDEQVHSPREHFHSFLRSLDAAREGLPTSFRLKLARALRHYGVAAPDGAVPAEGPELQEAVYRVFLAQQRIENQVPIIAALLQRWLTDQDRRDAADHELTAVLDRLVLATQVRFPVIGDLARTIRFRYFDEPRIRQAKERVYDELRGVLAHLSEEPDAPDHARRIQDLVATTEPLIDLLAQRISRSEDGAGPLLEVITRRYYKIRQLRNVRSFEEDGRQFVAGDFELRGQLLHLISSVADVAELASALTAVGAVAVATGASENLVVDLYLSWADAPPDADTMSTTLRDTLSALPLAGTCRRVTITVCSAEAAGVHQFTFRPDAGAPVEERVIRDMHPLSGQRLELWRLKHFDGTRLPAAPDTYLFHLVAKDNPADERLVALAEIRDVTPQRDDTGEVVAMPMIERTLTACLDGIRRAQSQRGARRRLDNNSVVLYLWPVLDVPLERVAVVAQNSAPLAVGVGLEEITLMARLQDQPGLPTRDVALRFSYRSGAGVVVTMTEPATEPLLPLDEYTQKVQRARARGTVYPYELIPLLTGGGGTFTEHDLDDDGRLVPVDRPHGHNRAGIVVGVVSAPTARHPEGMRRVALFGDPTKALGTVAEAECARVVAAIDLAEEMAVPVEWFALSSGATIAMDSGTENMDWVSRGLRRIITFTQGGGEINVVVAGINVGAQPYWNAEATMLMHTKGILVMTPDSAMVLTGKNSLDYSGGVSAEDNFGIGGYDRVMGPNGQAQYWAPDLTAAVGILFAHYEHAYVAEGERFPRRAHTTDPLDRDVCSYPHVHPSSDFTTVGDIFSSVTNPERKKPFDIRTVMRAVVDQDHAVLERWADMVGADTAVVLDAHLGGHPVSVVGIESRVLPRKGWVPADGPDQWTSGTLFPSSSKKTARAINAASGNRPLVVLANLSGFDGSPDSLRNLQLEYGAEIGRAIVNFDGPIVFCVVSRYHGGAFVVFSGALNDNLEVLAIEGSFASVIGGAPAAAVVFAREVNARISADPAVRDLEAALGATEDDARQAELRVELATQRINSRSAKLGEVAAEFEAVHNIERAREVGSVHAIIPAVQLRPALVAAVQRGIDRTVEEPDRPR
ncbi:MAG: carboxyl transferase domain-containing protein, partial [Mycobacteriaceae bacterium]